MRWTFLRRRRPPLVATPEADVLDKDARAEEAMAKAQQEALHVLELSSEIGSRVRENSWSPRVRAAFRAAPKH